MTMKVKRFTDELPKSRELRAFNVGPLIYYSAAAWLLGFLAGRILFQLLSGR